MKRHVLSVICLCLMTSQMAFAAPVRVHCQANGILFENVTEEQLEKDYALLPDENIAIVDESEIPQYKYPEQLSCQNGKLLFDPNFKPQYAIAAEQKQEQIKQAHAALDAELGKTEPDVITVLRLQRAIEQIKEGK